MENLNKQNGNHENTIDDLFHQLHNKANLLYKFAQLQTIYSTKSHGYGQDEDYSMIDLHTLVTISDEPGITVSMLANRCNRQKGTISQIVTKLEKLGCLEKIKKDDNAKTIYLYLLPKGKELAKSHKIYDIQALTRTIDRLLKRCTMEEINSFYKVIDVFNDILEEDILKTKK